MKIELKLVPQIVRPRVWSGTDWGEKIRVLVKRGDKELWWVPAHVAYIDRSRGAVSCKTELRVCAGVDAALASHNGLGIRPISIAEGGKLSPAAIMMHWQKLAEFFSVDGGEWIEPWLYHTSRKLPKDRQTLLFINR